jgi:hypothetical protein
VLKVVDRIEGEIVLEDNAVEEIDFPGGKKRDGRVKLGRLPYGDRGRGRNLGTAGVIGSWRRGGRDRRRSASRDRRLQFNGVGANLAEDSEVFGVTAEIGAELVAEVFFEMVALLEMMKILDSLLEADGDEEAYGDRGDVDDEVCPCVFGLVRDVDIEHVRTFEEVWIRKQGPGGMREGYTE